MKNLKKVLAMVLAFACTFTMFAGAKVFEDVPAGSDYSEAITMLSDLGIIQGKDDGKYHPEDTITRAEACALIARMMTGDPNVSQYVGAQNFTDVAKGSWKDSAIGYCYINNIVIGVGNNKFEPDRAITDAEFITMVVRAMGYETPDMAQGYPYTYMSNAQAIGLMDGVDMVANTDALRGEDAQVIYNALFADYARGAKEYNTTHGAAAETYPTLAESVWGLESAAVGVWQRSTSDDETMELTTCKAHTWVITGKSLEVGDVDMFEAYPIDDDGTYLYDHGQKSDNEPYYFTYNGDMANIADLKGYQVELWGMGAHDEPELTEVTDENGDRKKVYVYSSDWDINAIKTVNGQTKYDYTPADENLPDVDLDEVRGFVGGTFISNDVDDYIKWGDDQLSEDTVKDALQTKNSASYRVVDWDSDGTADFITGDIYKYYEVKAVTSKTIRLGGFDGKTEFVLDLDGETDVKIEGQDYTVTAEFPDDLEEGDVIQVSTEEVVGKKKIDSTWTVEKVEPETKEITSISSKKGVEFDDELIDVAHEDYSFKNTNSTYNGLNEDSADLWDLYLDNNGFIVKMEESEAAFTGYIFVTGADQGNNSSTGNRRSAQISGVNDQNEYMEDLELTKNANVEVWDGDSYEDGYDDREFNNVADNIKGRVFKYTLNDDGDVTRLVEVACENGSENYSYNEDTRAVDALDNRDNRTDRNWLQKASVIFAVEVDGSEWNTLNDTANIVAGTKLYMGNGDDATHNDKDIDPDNVIALDYTDVPDIDSMYNGKDSKTEARGILYNNDTSKDEIETVVLGVDDLNDFKSTSTKVALVTGLDYNMKGDKAETYDITAYVNGEEETEFNTIDVDDMTVNGTTKDTESIIDRIHDEVEDGKNGVYAELRFNKDGKVTELNVIDATQRFANTNAEYNVATEDAHYTVVRAVVNLRGDNDRLMVTPTRAIWDPEAEEMKLESVGNADFDTYYELDGGTAYFKLTDSLMLSNGDYMNAYKDAFDEDLAVETGDKADLISWIDSDNIEYEDDYTVADVIVDSTAASEAESVVAVYYHEDQVGEYGMLDGTVEVNGFDANDYAYAYGTRTANTEVICNDKNLLDGSEEITLYSVTTNAEGKEVKTEIKTVNAASYDFGTLDAGKYYVEATGINKATENNDRQPIDAMYVTVTQAYSDVTIVENYSRGESELDEIAAGSNEVWVHVVDQTNGTEMTGLTADDFAAKNLLNLDINITNCDGSYKDGYYLLTLAKDVGVTRDDNMLTVEFKGNKNYKGDSDDVPVVATPAAEYTQKLKVTGTSAADMKGTLTLEYTMDGMTVPQSVDINIWNSTSDGNPEAQHVAGWIAKQINDKVSGIEATAEDDATVVLTTKKPMELQVKSNTSKWNVALVK